jgi:hypothetical protein
MKEVKSVSRRFAVGALLAAALVGGCAAGSVGQRSSQTTPSTKTTTGAADSRDLPVVETKDATTPKSKPPVNYCANNKADQLVLVSIASQHAWLCEHSRTVYSTAVTTGMNTANMHTPTGNYQIQGRNRDTVLTLSNGDKYGVKYWIPFDAPLYGFHDSSWQHFPYGSGKYKSSGSHGCVHMPLAAMKYLYNWVEVGASVNIHA